MADKLQNLQDWLPLAKNYNVEVLLIHDKQDEETSTQLSQIKKQLQNSNVYLIERTVNSPGLARNVGLEYSIGDWVHFVDSDDIFLLPEVMKEITALHEPAIIAIAGRFARIDTVSRQRRDCQTWSGNKNKNLETIFLDPGLWRFTFRKKALNSKKFTNLHLAEDIIFLHSVGLRSNQIKFSDEITYLYHTGVSGQLSGKPKNISCLPEALISISKSPEKYPVVVLGIIHMRILLGIFKRKKIKILFKSLKICILSCLERPLLIVGYAAALNKILLFKLNSKRMK